MLDKTSKQYKIAALESVEVKSAQGWLQSKDNRISDPRCGTQLCPRGSGKRHVAQGRTSRLPGLASTAGADISLAPGGALQRRAPRGSWGCILEEAVTLDMQMDSLPSNAFWVCMLLVFLVCLCPAAVGLSPDGQTLIQFKEHVIDTRGRLSTWDERADSCCHWYGVTCDENGTAVVRLELFSCSLFGTVPGSLGALKSLLVLDLSGNFLSDAIPANISSLQSLKELRLHSNFLTGTIPILPASLQVLFLYGNRLTGGVPDFREQTQLRQVDVHDNNLTGGLPSSLPWSQLALLDVSGNQLGGPLPVGISNMSLVLFLNLAANNFVGDLPPGPWPFVPLALDLSGNHLTGSIPQDLLLGASYLNLSGNALTGSIDIPETLTVLVMQHLDLSNNQLDGNIPDTGLASMSGSLINLCLQNNYLSGSISNMLVQGSDSLVELRLGGNNLTVEIQDLELLYDGSFPVLEIIDLSLSRLQGELPLSLFQLSSLTVLDLSNNFLQGPIPVDDYDPNFMRNLRQLRLQGNALNGSILPNDTLLWSQFEVLDLSRNSLTWRSAIQGGDDDLQTIFDHYLNLRELRLGNNDLTTTLLPTRVGKLDFLHILDLSNCNLEGNISSEAFTDSLLPSVQYIDFSHNRLSGKVASSFTGMPGLRFLDISFNNLSGQLPAFPEHTTVVVGGNEGLCGGVLKSCSDIAPAAHRLWVILTISTVCLVVSTGSSVLLLCRWRKYAKQHKQDAELIKALLDRDSATLMSLRDLRKATDSFSEKCQIGVGGFGTVYSGTLTDGTVVAIKRSNRVETSEDICQFLNEVKILSQVHHRHLVRLLGCCLSSKVALLVFEYVPNGTLQDHLRRKRGEAPLTWTQRLRIAVQTADALDYLHSSANPPIYHLDVKSANILLDSNLDAKVADFGISKLAPNVDATHITARAFQGTIGYMDPESVLSSMLKDKSDVYAFGVVLLELVSAQAVVDITRGEGPEASLINFAVPRINADELTEIIDPRISDTLHTKDGKESIQEVCRLAVRCLKFRSKDRPTMKEVLRDLCTNRLLSCSEVEAGTPSESADYGMVGLLSPSLFSGFSKLDICTMER